MRNAEVLRRAKGKIEYTGKRRKTDWIGHVLPRNCLLKHVSEGKIVGTGRRGRRRKRLMDILRRTEDSGSWKRKH